MWKRLCVIGILMVSSHAHASILWFGGEDTSVTLTGGNTGVGAANNGVNTAFARVGLFAYNGTTVADPPDNRLISPTFTATSQLWVHAYVSSWALFSTTSGEQAMVIRSPDGVARILLRQTGTNGTVKVSTRDASATITDLATASGAFTDNSTGSSPPDQLDLFVNYTCSGAGGVQMWINKVQVINFSGNPCTNSATTLNQVEFASINNGSGGGGGCPGGSGGSCWSEMIVANEDTRSMHLATLILQGAGPTQGWTPNTLANVNKSTISDGTFVSDGTGNVLSQWEAPTTAPTGGPFAVKSVSIEARLESSATGPQNFDYSWHISGSDYLAGMTNALTNSFVNYRLQQDTSPATSTTWGIAEVYNTSTNQMSFGVKSKP